MAYRKNPMTGIGDLQYGDSIGDLTRLGGQITTTKKYLAQTGNGSASAAPTWSAIAEADVTNLVADLALKAPLASPALTGNPTVPTQAPSDNSTKIASTAYVNTAVLQSPAKEAVKYASVAVLPSIVYANGSSGVGATLTGVALGAISLDSSSPAVNDRVLIKNQASTFQNGIYTVTATGSGIAVFVLTRAIDFDESTDIKTGDSTYVTGGSTLAGTTWDTNSADSPTMGSGAITFAQTGGPGSVTGGNGITITGSSIAIDTSVVASKTDNLSVFAATTSAQLAGVLSDETGSGAAVFATSPTLVTPALGTPSSAVLTNATGLPVSTGISGLGTGVGTFLATPSSANLAAALTDETGSGAAVFGTSPNITTPTGIVKGDVGLGNVDNTSNATERAASRTLTNARVNPRVSTTASSATPTPNADTDDEYTVTALAASATFGAPTGTPVEGQKLIIRIKDNATAQTLAWNAIYRAIGVTLPSTTVISKTLYIGMIYNNTDTKWDVVSTAQQA